MNNGKFVISLDFELHWGVRDKKTFQEYGENIRGVHTVIPRLLNTFNTFDINATFSTVGFLFFENKAQLLGNIPSNLPSYDNNDFSPYLGHFNLVGDNYKEDLYHFAPQLIAEIKKYPKQEIGSHTFSHYYCLESGQTVEQFRDDITYAMKVATKNNVVITSLIFPRNQFNEEYLNVCNDLGIICYRGNEHSWLYEAKNGKQESSFRRALRLIDAYINISGHNCYSTECLKSKFPIDIPSSRFLRPFSNSLKIFDQLRLNRIKSGMTYAAKNNLTYHLWWHPHNFGINQNENFNFLEKILEHYKLLNLKYNFQSITMSNLAKKIQNEG
ncbi:polysaccharide deacetylase family protein [Chryseobacterium turcicum]|uniref:Polysaccharide deacetylase family protein n=1 Tax=Chryseobacterium turcicum TaxID=2898076 RepID=A0A9Q3V163_9FLAO|nr:polysaccharide deacetylase family protein [Chryseobacterium turcicum]MCD1116964.1 polysaccharide deacetylase family protein [Chryseobacterium turcicum]